MQCVGDAVAVGGNSNSRAAASDEPTRHGADQTHVASDATPIPASIASIASIAITCGDGDSIGGGGAVRVEHHIIRLQLLSAIRLGVWIRKLPRAILCAGRHMAPRKQRCGVEQHGDAAGLCVAHAAPHATRPIAPIRVAKDIEAWDAKDGRGVGRVEVTAENAFVKALRAQGGGHKEAAVYGGSAIGRR